MFPYVPDHRSRWFPVRITAQPCCIQRHEVLLVLPCALESSLRARPSGEGAFHGDICSFVTAMERYEAISWASAESFLLGTTKGSYRGLST